MKKIDITGWKDVFYFSFTQTLKSKSYKALVIIMCILSAAIMPIMYIISDNGDTTNVENVNYSDVVEDGNDTNDTNTDEVERIKLKMDTLYLNYDESDSDAAGVVESLSDMYDCSFEYADSEKTKEIRETINSNNKIALIIIDSSKGYYTIETVTSWDFDEIQVDVDTVSSYMSSMLSEIQMNRVFSQEEIEKSQKSVVGHFANESVDDSDGEINMFKYMFQLGIILVLIFMMSFSGESIATSIVTEKSGRLVEYLMTTIRPMALIVGKVLAVFTTVVIQFAAMILCAVLSGVIADGVFGIPVADSFIESVKMMTENGMFANVNPVTVIFAILTVVGGYMFFAFLAGLAGATVSKLEEMAEGIMLFTLVLLVGAYMGMALSMTQLFSGSAAEPGTFEMICYMLPISSMFAIPQNILFGDVSMGIALISMIIQYVSVALLLLLTSKVYDYMLFYNGATLKLKDIIHIARYGQRKGENK